MSPGAIDRRMRDLAQLYKVGISIQNAKRLGKRGKTSISDSVKVVMRIDPEQGKV